MLLRSDLTGEVFGGGDEAVFLFFFVPDADFDDLVFIFPDNVHDSFVSFPLR